MKMRGICRTDKRILGGVTSTIYNFIAPFNNPLIADLIHSNDPTHSLADIDKGKIICISLPPPLEAERRYVHTLLKMCFYLHAMARFSKTTQQRKFDNLLVLIADETQQIMNASSSSGLNDYEIIAKDSFSDHLHKLAFKIGFLLFVLFYHLFKS